MIHWLAHGFSKYIMLISIEKLANAQSFSPFREGVLLLLKSTLEGDSSCNVKFKYL